MTRKYIKVLRSTKKQDLSLMDYTPEEGCRRYQPKFCGSNINNIDVLNCQNKTWNFNETS